MDLTATAATNESRLQPGVHPLDAAAPAWSLRRPDIIDPRFNAFGRSNLSRNWGSIWNVFVEQKVRPNLDVALGFMSERSNTKAGSFMVPHVLEVKADPNLYLPDKTPNPNAGDVYVDSLTLGTRSFINQDQLRATVAYAPDLTRSRGWWRHFGRYQFAGYFESWRSENKSQSRRLSTIAQEPWMAAAVYNNATQGNRILATRYYVGDSSYRPLAPLTPDVLELPEPMVLTSSTGRTLEYRMWTHPGGSERPAGSKQEADSLMASGQGFFLQDKVVVYGGYREDRVKRAQSLTTASITQMPWRQLNGTVANSGLYPDLYATEFVDWDFRENGNTFNWGAIVRPLSWFQLHYADSENFSVRGGTSFTPYGEAMPGPKGQGRDYGASIFLAENRLMLRLNFWTTDELNGRPSNTIIGAIRNPIIEVENRILAVAPGTAPLGVDFTRYNPFDYQVASYRESAGLDFELVANLGGWRLMASAGRQETRFQVDNAWFRWVADRLPTWQTFGRGWNVETVTDNTTETIRQQYNDWIATVQEPIQAANGTFTDSQRKWRANLTASHVFSGGRLKGATLGAAVRYRDAPYVGYRLSKTSSGQEIPDLNRPLRGQSEVYFDAFARYALPRLAWLGQRTRASAQLNVQNLLDAGDLNIVSTKVDGSPKVYRHEAPRRITFALKFTL
jgi:hypothetical protein